MMSWNWLKSTGSHASRSGAGRRGRGPPVPTIHAAASSFSASSSAVSSSRFSCFTLMRALLQPVNTGLRSPSSTGRPAPPLAARSRAAASDSSR